MICYFSATGNSKYAAERIAKATGDEAVSIEKIKGGIFLAAGEALGIVTPTYCLGLPVVVEQFIKNLKFDGAAPGYVFLVATYGTSPGFIARQTARLLSKKRLVLDAAFGVKMPDNYTPVFDVSDKNKIDAKLAAAESYIDSAIDSVNARLRGNRTKRRIPYQAHIFARGAYGILRKTKKFRVNGDCIGCGLCEKNCPMGAIELGDKKPVWVKDKCAACLRCLHLCPRFAIERGKATRKHGQYKNPNVKI